MLLTGCRYYVLLFGAYFTMSMMVPGYFTYTKAEFELCKYLPSFPEVASKFSVLICNGQFFCCRQVLYLAWTTRKKNNFNH